MKNNLAAFEVYHLVKELQFLVNGKIDQVYNPNDNEVILQFHIPGIGKKILRLQVPNFFYITEYKEQNKEPSGLCLFLRKKLANARLRAFNLLGFERVIEFQFESKEKFNLIFEFFSKGNILLTDEKYTILSATEQHEWKDRQVKIKASYVAPKREHDFLTITKEQLNEMLSSSDKESVVKSLAIDLGLGGVYSEQLVSLTKINKDKKPNALTDKEVTELYKSCIELRDSKPSAIIYKDNNIVKDVCPIEITAYSSYEKVKFEYYYQAIDDYVTNMLQFQQKLNSPHEKEIKKLLAIIETQKKQLLKLNLDEEEERKKAELIYSNYSLVKELIEEINKASKKYSFKEIKEKLKGHKIIKEVNSKDKTLVVELQ